MCISKSLWVIDSYWVALLTSPFSTIRLTAVRMCGFICLYCHFQMTVVRALYIKDDKETVDGPNTQPLLCNETFSNMGLNCVQCTLIYNNC